MKEGGVVRVEWGGRADRRTDGRSNGGPEEERMTKSETGIRNEKVFDEGLERI